MNGNQNAERKNFFRGWGRFVWFVFAGLWSCFLVFDRTPNWLLRLVSLLVFIAVMLDVFAAKVNKKWQTQRNRGFDRVLGIVFFVSGVIYVWIGARPPHVWFFGLPGIIFLAGGFFIALDTFDKVIGMGGKEHRQ
ncbi:MAG TPA: hypothetical protein VJA94_10510 [Candidatus Angelobacter sp.]